MNASEPRDDAVAEWRTSLEWVAASQTTDEYPRLAAIDSQAAREIIAALAQQRAEPVAWQLRFQFSYGDWSGWTTHTSAGECEHMASRYQEMGVPVETRALVPATGAPR